MGTTAETLTQALADRVAVVETTTRVAVLADRRRWAELRGCFTTVVHVDYTALAGGDPEELRADELITRWQGLLESFKATQHQLSNHLVKLDGDAATCAAEVRATHYQPRDDSDEGIWQVGGFYEYGLVRAESSWVVHSMRFVPTWSHGDRSLSPTGAQVNA